MSNPRVGSRSVGVGVGVLVFRAGKILLGKRDIARPPILDRQRGGDLRRGGGRIGGIDEDAGGIEHLAEDRRIGGCDRQTGILCLEQRQAEPLVMRRADEKVEARDDLARGVVVEKAMQTHRR